MQHTYLPTSGQGAGQSIEDAATVAIALELAGRNNVKNGLMAAEKLRYVLASADHRPIRVLSNLSQKKRYQRACKIQKMGIETRDAWHKTN